MKFEISICGYSTPQGAAALGAALGDVARAAEDAGISALWVMDHLFQIEILGPPEQEMLEGYSVLAFLAAQTSKVRLGTLVAGVTYRHPGILVKQVTALDVLSELISGGRGTVLDDALFYETNLATSVGSWTHNGQRGGEFVLYAAGDNHPLPDLLEVMDQTLSGIRTDGIDEATVARVVARLRTAFVREIEDRPSLANHLGDCVVTWGDASCRAAELERYMAVTPEDVQRVARTWLGPDRVVLSVVSLGEEDLAVPSSVPLEPP